VVDRPEEIFQISFYDPLRSALYFFPHLAHCVLRRSSSPVSEVGVIEYRFEKRLQSVEQCLLAYPVINSRDSQHSILARLSRFWNLYLPHRAWLIDLLLKFPMQPI
jgi:hypothetical protein